MGLLRKIKRARAARLERGYVERLGRTLAEDWEGFSAERFRAGDGLFEVPCTACPKYADGPPRCTVPIGSRVRSCICASTEYHLRATTGKLVLELGCGESSFARACLREVGARWIGLDQEPPRAGREAVRALGAQVQHLPFLDESFDVVCGIQTIEHWECPLMPPSDCTYARTMREIWRVLRPGGWVYLDGPIGLHGAPEFIRGDLEAIRGIFADRGWANLTLTGWRRRHGPLRGHRAPRKERARWPRVLPGTDAGELARLGRGPVWILALRAEKPAVASG